ncbi:MAG: glycosyltransferase [Alphaproteobacteria bacterium]
MPRPKVLFLSPVIPRSTGGGTAMRARRVLETLQSRFDVFLVIADIIRGETGQDVPSELDDLVVGKLFFSVDQSGSYVFRSVTKIRSVQVRLILNALLPRALFQTMWDRRARALVADAFGAVRFDAIHAFRLNLAPMAVHLAKAQRGRKPALFLDIDDFESKATRRAADLLRGRMGRQWYLVERLEAKKFELEERRLFHKFDCVFVCSTNDRHEIERRYGYRSVSVLPNTVALPTVPNDLHRDHDRIFTLLFVGSMAYVPNEDAVLFFCDEVLPILRRIAPGRFRFDIVGKNPTGAVRSLGNIAEVTVVGEVPDVAPHYRACDIVLAPIRTGGGTRIKILEAFSFRKPVVSTTIGAEGIDVTPGKDILIGDDPEALARACHRLMVDETEYENIADAGLRLVTSRYSPKALETYLFTAYDATLRSVASRVLANEHGVRSDACDG